MNETATQSEMSPEKAFLRKWESRIVATQKGHYLSAQYYSRQNYVLGVPVIVLSTIVGTSVFATLQQQKQEIWIQILVGLASVAAAVLASLQTFLGFSDRAEKHRVAGAKYGAVGREVEALISFPPAKMEERLDSIRQRLDALALESPNVPAKIYEAARMKLHEIDDEKPRSA